MFIPYHIFVRANGRLSDTYLLSMFGLDEYRPVTSPRRYSRYALLANDSEWTMLADDMRYTLWHLPSTDQAVHQLGQSFDVFTCSVGDTDQSFDFVYYRNGHEVRRYVAIDPHYRGREVTENIGDPLPGEAIAFRETDEQKIVLAIAASLGIRTEYSAQEIREYAPPSQNRETVA